MKNFNLTQGGILRKLMQVAVPIMGSQFLQLSYTLMDMFWVGRLGDMYGAGPTDGSDAVAATGAAGMFIWLSMAFMFFGRMGAEIGVSQNLGKGDVKEARRFAGNSIFIAAASGLLFGVLCIFAAPWLISFFAIPDAHVAADAATYLMIVGFGFPFVFVSSAINGAFNGSGNSRLPFWANSIGFIINMILSPLLIFPAGLGIMGAAIATVAANLITFGIMLWAMKHNKGRPFERYAFFAKPRLREVKQIFKWSLPISAESLLFTFFSMILTRMVFDADFGGTAAQSVMRIGGEIESLSWLIGGGFGSAVTAFIGQNYGANKWTRIHKGRRIAIATMCVWGGLVMLSFLLFGEQLFTLFLRYPPDIVEGGRMYLKILAFCQIAMCVEAVAAGVMRGMGKTMPPSVISISANALRIPLCYILANFTPLGLNGIWLGITIGACLRGFGMFLWCSWDARKRPKMDDINVPSLDL